MTMKINRSNFRRFAKWKERSNPIIVKERTSMASVLEWKQRPAGWLLKEEERKAENGWLSATRCSAYAFLFEKNNGSALDCRYRTSLQKHDCFQGNLFRYFLSSGLGEQSSFCCFETSERSRQQKQNEATFARNVPIETAWFERASAPGNYHQAQHEAGLFERFV